MHNSYSNAQQKIVLGYIYAGEKNKQHLFSIKLNKQFQIHR